MTGVVAISDTFYSFSFTRGSIRSSRHTHHPPPPRIVFRVDSPVYKKTIQKDYRLYRVFDVVER